MNFENQELYTNEFFEWHVKFKDNYKIISDWILNNCDFKNSLEIGCGNAFISEYFYDVGKDVMCSDFSMSAYNYISPKIGRAHV
jgi:hypothetical protein